MNQQVKQLWVNALRSGKYVKGVRRLKKRNIADGSVTYCCLGVLCELALEKGILKRSDIAYNYGDYSMEKDGYNSYTYAEEVAFLPGMVANWAGIPENPSVKYGGHRHNITLVNDDSDTTFEEIADLIEEHL